MFSSISHEWAQQILVRYKVEHKRYSISYNPYHGQLLQATMNYFAHHLNIKIMTLLMDFLKISDHFPNISGDFQKLSKGKNICKCFPKKFWRWPRIKYNWRLLKTSKEDTKMFWSYTNKFKYSLRIKHGISQVSNIFTNVPPESQKWFCMNFMSGAYSSVTLVSV